MSKRPILLLLIAVIAIGGLIFGISRLQSANAVEYSADVIVQLNSNNIEGFARANDVREFKFPQDFGAHPEYQTEWWYYTGNLATSEDRRFGFQLALFRRAITPTMPERSSEWASNQVYFGDFALTNVGDNQFFATNRFSRGAAGLSGASVDPRFHVWVEDWSVTALNDDASQLRIKAQGETAQGTYAIDLTTTRNKPLVFHGEKGLSRKNADVGNASYYFSQTRLITEGTITINGQNFAVKGSSWMDQEFSTSVLGKDAVGWDWFALQLDNQREIMLFYIRMADGSIEPLSKGTLVEADGSTTTLNLEDYKIEVLDHWLSPRTGANYPSGWRIQINASSGVIALEVQPLIKDQELNSVTAYWEGASRITGTDNGQPVTGYGYVEMTGYNHATSGERGGSANLGN
ncbi:MAG: carotenoid 1,2-hydratase [Anaerolineae bacterium]|nr:carotenoid 1,2-hydratase [Anaerolineae bacterium]